MTDVGSGKQMDAREARYSAEAAVLTEEHLRAAVALLEANLPGDPRLRDGSLLGAVVQAIAINYQTVRRK